MDSNAVDVLIYIKYIVQSFHDFPPELGMLPVHDFIIC